MFYHDIIITILYHKAIFFTIVFTKFAIFYRKITVIKNGIWDGGIWDGGIWWNLEFGTVLFSTNPWKREPSQIPENENKKILNEKVILKDKYDNLEKHLNKKYDDLLKETLNLYKIIDTLEKILKKFITWICKKFSNTEEEDLIRKFQQETDTFINPEKQIEYETEQEIEL